MEKIFSKTSRYSTESVQTENLGIASPVPMGSWNKAIMYQKLNYVRHNQATYLAKKSNTNFEPGVATNWEEVWMLFNYDGGSVSPDGTYPNMTVGNSPKSLYNLGAYDTYVDNGDETVTVTRKTGYYKIDGNFTANYIWSDFKNMISVEIPNVDYDTPLVASIKTSQDVWNNGNPIYDYAIEDHISNDEGHGVRLVVKNATSQQEFRDYVSQHPIYIQYELATSEQYTETLPADVPLNTLDANMSDIVREEVEKTLNLINVTESSLTDAHDCSVSYSNGILTMVPNAEDPYVTISKMTLSEGTYTFSLKSDFSSQIYVKVGDGSWNESVKGKSPTFTFTVSSESTVIFRVDGVQDGTANPQTFSSIMLNEGSHAYPYQPYNGAIVHEIRTPLYFSTDNVSPASIDQIGGNWTSLGSFMVGSNTIYAWKKA